MTKTIACRNGEYAIAPYPHVTKVTSYQAQAKTLAEFHALLLAHAKHGHCLFNGQLTQPLTDESRAGKTRKGEQREWIVFDFDKVDAVDHSDAVRLYLPPECQQVSYIVQHSASMFVPGSNKFSGHIFMLLKTPLDQQGLLEWFRYLNFSLPNLKNALELSRSAVALHWPLDCSAAYDSKLIYIAPPKCHGFAPKVKDPIQLVKKKQTHLDIKRYPPIARSTIDDKINELRQAIGMLRSDLNVRKHQDSEVLIGGEAGFISDVKPMGEHYIKFNLNGGDSMGYWIDLRAPELVKNFKGEPWLLTKEIDEKFYNALIKKAPRILAQPAIEEGLEVLAFYATNRSSQIKIGTFAPGSRTLTLNNATETSARAWLSEFGILGQPIEHMDLIFDPTSDVQYVANSKCINFFRATDYMLQEPVKLERSTLAEIPPVFNKTFVSVLGNPSKEVYVHFINWLAHIFQTRQKAQTAWVLSGRTGTGKGSFARYILAPLFGQDCVHIEQFTAVGQQFNGYLERSLFVIFDEADTRMVPNAHELMAKLRHWITDSPLSIRRMNVDHYNAPNFSNFIFFANERTSVAVSADDRRFNFSERQETEINYTPNELLVLKEGKELQAFADVLRRWPVDVEAVTKIITTRTQADVHEATTPVNQLIAEAIIKGDLQFFLDRTPSDTEAASDFFNRFNPLGLYKAVMDKYIKAAQVDTPAVVTEPELFTIFRTLIPDTRYFQDSKTWRKRHYKTLGLDISKQFRIPGEWDKREYGMQVAWIKPDSIPPLQISNEGKVVSLPKPPKRKRK